MSGKVFNEKCVITGGTARYRDPLTGLAYSDLAAFKILRERYNSKDEAILSLVDAARSASAHEQARENNKNHDGAGDGDGNNDGSQEHLLTESQLLLIEKDDEIKKIIRDEQMAKLLIEIDRSDNPQKKLTQCRKENHQIEEFVARVLQVVQGEQR